MESLVTATRGHRDLSYIEYPDTPDDSDGSDTYDICMRTHLMTVMRAFWWKEGGFMWKFKFIINVVWLWLLTLILTISPYKFQ